MPLMKPFKVRDFRKKAFFLVDDVYLNGYAKLLGSHASCVYFSLCRHTNKDQSAFPSEDLIATEFNMDKRTVIRKLKLLQDWNIIKIERTRDDKGKWLRNTYYLLDKEEWVHPSDTESHGYPSDSHAKNHVTLNTNIQVTQSHTKDTHYIKDTHNKDIYKEKRMYKRKEILSLPKKYSNIDDIKEEDMVEISNHYHLPLSFVKSKYEDMCLWVGEKEGRGKGRNWRLTLMSWVKKDGLALLNKSHKGGVLDATDI